MTITFFDKLILLGIFGSISAAVFSILLAFKFKLQKHLFRIGAFLCMSIAITIFYGSFIEPFWIEFKTQSISLNDSPSQNIKIVLVSDFHLGPYKGKSFVEDVVSKINKLQPDLILIPGDFIYSYADQIAAFEPFNKVTSKYGIYATLGNHDYGLTRSNQDDGIYSGAITKSDTVYQYLTELGITVLRNEKEVININGSELVLVGLEDLWGNLGNLEQPFTKLTSEQNVIVIEHNPDIVLNEFTRVADLIVSGHTHGGQIRLPFIGPVAGVPTKLGNTYTDGLFKFGDTQLYITKGIGEMGPRARLFTRPEIVILNVSI